MFRLSRSSHVGDSRRTLSKTTRRPHWRSLANLETLEDRLVLSTLQASGVSLPDATQGVSTGPLTVATFTNEGGLRPNADSGLRGIGPYSATIDWGDGTSGRPDVTPATIAYDAETATFRVSGDHLYYAPGDFAVAVAISQGTGTAQVVHDSIHVSEQDLLNVNAVPLTGEPGQPFNNVIVATFTDGYPFDNNGAPTSASSYTATIDWGDNTSSIGTITPNGSGGYKITGTHAYPVSAFYTTYIDLFKNDLPSDDTYGYADVTINPTWVHASELTVTATEGQTYTGPVASIATNDWTLTPSNFSATINWSDGFVQTGTVTGSNGAFTISGAHTFSDEGTYAVSVKIVEVLPQSDQDVAWEGIPPLSYETAVEWVTSSVNVLEGDVLTPQGNTLSGARGGVWTGVVATFSDSNTASPAADFTAVINWGDGSKSAGTVSGGNGALSVSGTHAYTTISTYRVTVTLSERPPGTATATAQSMFTVSPANSDAVSTGSIVVITPSGMSDSTSPPKPSNRRGS